MHNYLLRVTLIMRLRACEVHRSTANETHCKVRAIMSIGRVCAGIEVVLGSVGAVIGTIAITYVSIRKLTIHNAYS